MAGPPLPPPHADRRRHRPVGLFALGSRLDHASDDGACAHRQGHSPRLRQLAARRPGPLPLADCCVGDGDRWHPRRSGDLSRVAHAQKASAAQRRAGLREPNRASTPNRINWNQRVTFVRSRVFCAESRTPAAPLKPRAIRCPCVQRHLKKENHPTHGQNCQDRRSQEDDGHHQVHRLSQVLQTHAHRQACQGPRARRPRRSLHLVFRVRLLRKALSVAEFRTDKSPASRRAFRFSSAGGSGRLQPPE